MNLTVNIFKLDTGNSFIHKSQIMGKVRKAKAENIIAPIVDVLLLHGRDLELVKNFEEILSSIGLTAKKVIDLPSLDLDVDERVDHYIELSRLRIVIASFDEAQKDASTSRPNVYDEISRCLKKSSGKNLIALREMREGKLVELPSNVETKLKVVIQFERGKLELAIPKLLREVISRELPATLIQEISTEHDGARILVPFMVKMDKLWDEFTAAWNKVHSADADAESKLTIYLDKFFQKYHAIFKSYIQKGKRGKELSQACDEAHEKSLNHLANSWVSVLDSKRREADRLHKNNESQHRKIFEDAMSEYRKVEKADTDKIKIDRAKEVFAQFEKFIGLAS